MECLAIISNYIMNEVACRLCKPPAARRQPPGACRQERGPLSGEQSAPLRCRFTGHWALGTNAKAAPFTRDS